MNLVALLRERAEQHPERPALIDRKRGEDRVKTFGELLLRVEQGSAQLRQMGLKRGQTILLFQPVSIELYEILLSAFHSGLRVMLADPSAGKAFLTLCCGRLAPDAFFGPWKAQLLRRFVPALKKIPLAIRSDSWFPGTAKWVASGDGVPLLEVPDEEPALITFTSGSTGVPKAAVRTHGFLLAQHKALSHALDFKEGEVDLITLPVFVLANLASGLTSVLADTDLRFPGKADGSAIHAQSQRHGVTRCAASPAFFSSLLRSTGSLACFRKIYTGGAAVFPDLLEKLSAAVPQAEVTAVFGSTEAEPMTHLEAADYDERRKAMTAAGFGLCAGFPVEEVELRLIRDHWGQSLKRIESGAFDALACAPGQAGEVVVTGDHVLTGYLGGIGDEETKIHVSGEVWHRTGDAGWMDESGCLWLLGRCSAKLPPSPIQAPTLPSGALDYPFAIESALRVRHPEVKTAALGWKGRRILVAEGLPSGNGADALPAEARDFGIEEVIRVAAIPMDRRHNAKIDYNLLHALLEKSEKA